METADWQNVVHGVISGYLFKAHLLALFPCRLILNYPFIYNHTAFSKYNFLHYTSRLCIFCTSCLQCLLTRKCLFQSLKLENPSFILLLYSNLTLHKNHYTRTYLFILLYCIVYTCFPNLLSSLRMGTMYFLLFHH